MSQFVAIPGERSLTYSPVAIQLKDDFTGQKPLGRTELILQEEDANDEWRTVNVAPFRNSNDIFSWPGLGRTVDVTRPARNHRVLIESEYYERFVPSAAEEFLVHGYNDDKPLPLNQYARTVRELVLMPNSRYPFPTHVPVLRGRVTHDNQPVEKAEVQHQSLKSFTDRASEFSLPVRIPAEDTQTTALSELNQIKVANARGYARAVLGISVAGEENLYRVIQIIWEDNSTPPQNHAATLTLEPLDGSDDLPPSLPADTEVSLVKFALLIDIPPLALNEIDDVHDVDPAIGFQTYQEITIQTP